MEATTNTKFKTVDEYLSLQPKQAKALLQKMRETIKKAAPQAEETISYNMPAFKLHGILVYYAAHTAHIGFYPTASAIEVFKKELSDYKCSKGAIQFPTDQALPLALVRKIVLYRVQENKELADFKKKRK